ncbi:MAG: arginine--tRNA ligase [Acutalibacteraceae bacterium]|nr:arginine--tRNA ligase [Acutalibacteraceae bacterium]
MSKIVDKAYKDIKNIITDAVKQSVADGQFEPVELPEFNIEVPADRTHGDFAVNAAMVYARHLHNSPVKIASVLKEHFDFSNTYISRCEIAGPGFINFFLNDNYYSDILIDIEKQADNYGRSDYGKGKSVLVEFVSANPTGPMHIGNARGGALGDCLAAVLDYAGFDVKREFYINDAGNQIEKFKTSLEIRYLQQFDSSIEMPEDAYLGNDIVEHAKEFTKVYGDKYVNADSEERRQALCDFALPKNIKGLEQDLAKYRIHYDNWFKESDLHNNGKVQEILDKMIEKGVTYEKDGALWFKSTEYGEDKDRVLVRDNGIPTYFVPDIAYHYNKLVERNFDIAIDILGADHHGYVPRMKAALQALDVDPDRLNVVIMQMVRLIKDGETYKVSKRSGKAVTLTTLLDEIPIDAARFLFNMREPNSHLELDLDLAVEKSSQNPVYYVQYAYARICSIVKNLKAEGINYTSCSSSQLSLLTQPEERALIQHLSTLENEIVASAKVYDPSKITKYVIDLATMFHKYYNACRVKCDDADLMQARLYLCVRVGQVIKNILTMLKIDSPEVM